MNTGNIIRKAREKKKLTQSDLADRMFLDRSAISRWERNICKPTEEQYKQLSSILDISFTEDIRAEETESKPAENPVLNKHILFYVLLLTMGFLSGSATGMIICIIGLVYAIKNPVPKVLLIPGLLIFAQVTYGARLFFDMYFVPPGSNVTAMYYEWLFHKFWIVH